MAANIKRWVPLGQAGIEREIVDSLVDKVCHSEAFAKAGNAKKLLRFLVDCSMDGVEPTPEQIAYAGLERDSYAPGDSIIRNVARDLRLKLEIYKTTEAQPDEIPLDLPLKTYVIYAPRAKSRAAASSTAHHLLGRVQAKIASPRNMEEVYSTCPVRGRIDALNLDLWVWLVVQATDFFFYPQCRVSRQNPEWEYNVRIGRMQWGETDGVSFIILLLAVDEDGDFAFRQYQKACGDGFGTTLPKDTWVLDSKTVIRRDIRPGQPNDPSRELA